MLAVAGLLNPEMGGPGFSDYREVDSNGTAYFLPFDPAGSKYHRRSVYRFTPRGANQGLLDSFDCPDPATATPRRNVTTTPIQALALWNDAFTLRMADALSRGVESEIPGEGAGVLERRCVRIYRRMLQREPRPRELELARGLVKDHGPAALCRALFNSNEFVMVQ